MFAETRRQKGFLTAEMLTAVGVLGVLMAGLAVSLRGFSMFNELQWARQRCTAAAEAQLDSIAATGKPLGPQECRRTWPNVDVSLRREPGQAQWVGLELIQVTAATQAGSRMVTIHLARYVRSPADVAEGGPL